MNLWKIVTRNLFYYTKNNLAVLFGIVICTGIIVGALSLGDSMKYSLEKIVEERLGRIDFAVTGESGTFRHELATRLSKYLDTDVIPVLRLKATAVNAGKDLSVNNVQVTGITSEFNKMRIDDADTDIPVENKIWMNERLATALGLGTGDDILLKILSINTMPLDAPFSSESIRSIPVRVRIEKIIPTAELANFNLAVSQVPPFNIFISMEYLSHVMNLEGRANTLLVSANGDPGPDMEKKIASGIKSHIRLTDIGYDLRENAYPGFIELVTDRIFIGHAMGNAVTSTIPGAMGILTYFINGFESGKLACHYAFASGIPEGYASGIPLEADEMIANIWLADELALRPGSKISLTYYALNDDGSMIETSNDFIVKSINNTTGLLTDSSLMPEYPGFSNAQSCSDFDPGIEIDLDNITTRDEEYWGRFKGTPKAYIALDRAKEIWGNKFGNLTSIRFSSDTHTKDEIESAIIGKINFKDFGITISPVKQKGITASGQGVDFSQLLLGLSMFIILSALIFMGLFLYFNLETREKEIGILKSIGLSKRNIVTVLIAECGFIVIIGSILGVFFGLAYNNAILFMLRTMWIDAVNSSSLYFHFTLRNIGLAILSGGALSLGFAIVLILGYLRKPAAHSIAHKSPRATGQRTSSVIVSLVFFLVSVCIVILAIFNKGQATIFFMISGMSFLAFFISLSGTVLSRFATTRDTSGLSDFGLGLRNAVTKKRRSLAIIGIIACGIFIIITVSMNRTYDLASGTGGFSLYAETSILLTEDIDKIKNRYMNGFDDAEIRNIRFISLKRKELEDASCLNLNRTTHPSIVGVDPGKFIEKSTFSFASLDKGIDPKNPWKGLLGNTDEDFIPGIIDDTVLTWGLGLALGDSIAYEDEKGKEFRIKIIGTLNNSIFQGQVLIAEKAFRKVFPSSGGYSIILADGIKKERMSDAKAILGTVLLSHNADITMTEERLRMFYKVEDTYLSIFFILGGLGLILGTFGLGGLVVKNILESRRSISILRAVGFGKKSIIRMICAEYFYLFLCGVLAGSVSAIIALIPTLSSSEWLGVLAPSAVVILVIILTGSASIYVAVRKSIGRNADFMLRSE